MGQQILGSCHIEDATACPGCERMAKNGAGQELSISRRYPRAKIPSRFRVSSMHAYDGKLKPKSTRSSYNEFLYRSANSICRLVGFLGSKHQKNNCT